MGAEVLKIFVTPNLIVVAVNVTKVLELGLLTCFIKLLFDFSVHPIAGKQFR
jgi:hypothetical protein